jgi:hypothetical protein
MICVVSSASAQQLLGPEAIDMAAAKLQPGQSMVQGETKLTLNQRNAGAKDSNGWYLLKSANGGFAIRFPGPITDETVYARTPDGRAFEQNTLTTRITAMSFIAACTRTLNQKLPPDTIGQAVSVIAGFSKQFKSAPFKNGAISGVEYSGLDPKGSYFVGQSFMFGDQFCGLLVGSHEPLGGIPPQARTAFDSFRPADGKP